MKEQLPLFRFHPDPLATGAVETTDLCCAACGEVKGYRVSSNYGVIRHDCICPWCVANGRAARELDASFVQDAETELPKAIWDELNQRTPGYISWQGEFWLVHCGEPCTFHGDLPQEEILSLPLDAEAKFLQDNDWIEKHWEKVKAAYYQGNAHEALYKFTCLHCGLLRIGIDFT